MTASIIASSNTPIQAKPEVSQQTPAQSDKHVSELTLAQLQKLSLNAAILESTQVTISAQDKSLGLLLNTAIDKLNELLAPELGADAIQKTADSGLDMSPEATAERIVSLSTAFFSAFKDQHPGEEESVVLEVGIREYE